MKHSHYHKTMPSLNVDVYRVLLAFEVTDPCLQHSIKKLLVAGGRGAKDAKKDVEEAIDSLVRWLEMRREESGENLQGNDLKVSICDSMNLADSFLSDAAKGLMSWGAEMGMKWKECDSRTDIRATELAYAENQHKTLWTEADEERMRVVLSNGNDGEVYKQDDGWIEWKGGECPVAKGSRVNLRYRDGIIVKNCMAVCMDWEHGNDPDGEDIVAYKIVQDMTHEDGECQGVW